MLGALFEPHMEGIEMPKGSRRIIVVGAAFAVVTALLASGPSGKASGAAAATFTGTAGTVSRSASGQFPTNPAASRAGGAAQKDPFVASPAGHRGANAAGSHGAAPKGADSGLSTSGTNTVHNFTGLNSVDQFNAYGGSHGGFVLAQIFQ
jgi:hypothetical protein